MSPADRAAPLSSVLGGAARELTGRNGLTAVVGVGVDAVDVERFRRVLDRRRHLAERLFTGGERAYAGAASDPVPRLSTRFAAKEATMKALGVGLGAFPFADVEVVRHGLEPRPSSCTGRPSVRPGRPGWCGGTSPSPTPTRWPWPWWWPKAGRWPARV